MANHHPKAEKELVQEEVLLDDPDFLKEIVRRVLQQLLETEMTEHIGAALTSALRIARAIATVISPGPSKPAWAS
jgi:transposase-like protein